MPTTPKVIGAHMWNFKPNSKCSPLKFFGGPPTRFLVCASKPWPVSSACKNLRGHRPLAAEIQSSEKCPVGCVNMRVYNFAVTGPKFKNFFHPIGDKIQLIKYFSDFRYVHPFRRYLWSKSTVVKNRAKFRTFFTLPNFVGGTSCKISIHLITLAMSHIR